MVERRFAVTREIDKLYMAANDYEADVLDRLREKAGITWEHRSDTCRWTNLVGSRCERCGMTQKQAERRDET
jgi:hypothetical protein